MKKIIDKKVYNTETAVRLYAWTNGYGGGDFNYRHEVLYVTKKGQYFIHGCGGAMSKYCKCIGNGQCGGEDIILLTKDEAYEWAENLHLDDFITDHFGNEIEEG